MPGYIAFSPENHQMLASYFKDLIKPNNDLYKHCDVEVIYAIPTAKRRAHTKLIKLTDSDGDGVVRSYDLNQVIDFIHTEFARPLGARLAKHSYHLYKDRLDYQKISHLTDTPISNMLAAALSPLPLINSRGSAGDGTTAYEQQSSGIYLSIQTHKLKPAPLASRLDQLSIFNADHKLIFIDIAPMISIELDCEQNHTYHISEEMEQIFRALALESANQATRTYLYNSQYNPETNDLMPEIVRHLLDTVGLKGPVSFFKDYQQLNNWIESRFSYRFSHLRDGHKDQAYHPQMIYISPQTALYERMSTYFGEMHVRRPQHIYLSPDALYLNCGEHDDMTVESLLMEQHVGTHPLMTTSREVSQDSGLDGITSPPPPSPVDTSIHHSIDSALGDSQKRSISFADRHNRPLTTTKLFDRDDRVATPTTSLVRQGLFAPAPAAPQPSTATPAKEYPF